MSSRRSKRGDDDDDSKASEDRDQRKREREERRKQRDDDGSKADVERQQAREDRRKKRESGEDTSSSRTQREENEQKEQHKKEEEEKQKRQKQERQKQEREQEESQRQEKHKEEAPASKAAADKTDGPQSAFDKISDDRKRRIIDSLIDTLYELAEQKEAKSKPAPTTASSGSSTADVSALDLKVRSLRTRLRNAENATSTLAKQEKDIEVKIKLNHQEVEKLKGEYASAEVEYNEAVKSGGVPTEAPKRGRGSGAKGSGFFDVVKKAQSSLWEDKFRAFKEKQRGSATNQPQWVNNLKKSDSHIIGTTVMKREDPEKKKEKAAWQNQPKLHKAVMDPRGKKEVEPTGAKKPAWSGVSLKKAENK